MIRVTGHKRLDLYATGPANHNVVCECGWRAQGHGPNRRANAIAKHDMHKAAVADVRAIAAMHGVGPVDRAFERTLPTTG